jgi:hypothetical protein
MDRRNNAAADRQELLRRNEHHHSPSPPQHPSPNETAAPNVVTQSPARWAPDPYQRYELRYYDGHQWTHHVSTAGLTGVDPVA